MFDLFFYYKFIIRYISFLKEFKRIKYYDDFFKLYKFAISFDIKNITDINQNAILSCIYFFKYYYGIIPYFTNYNSIFKLNISYFSFVIEYIFKNKIMFYSLYFLLNDIYFMINKNSIKIKNCESFWEFYIMDMNFFLEKKNTLGFFNLKHKLYFKIYSDLKFNIIDFLKLKNA